MNRRRTEPPVIEWALADVTASRMLFEAGPHSQLVATWRCPVCRTAVPRRRRAGRHRVYCTNSCKQKAYRHRRRQRDTIPADLRHNPRPGRAATYDRMHAIREFRDLSTGQRDSTGRGITVCGTFARMSIDKPNGFGHTRFEGANPGDPIHRARICRRCETLSGASPPLRPAAAA